MKPVNRPENKQTGSQEARRKIIKGIAGLPAVYTLSSGAHAATASALECVDPASGKYTPPVNLNTPPGTPQYDCVPDSTSLRNLEPIYGSNLKDYYDLGDTTAVRQLSLDGGVTNNKYCVRYVDQNGAIVSFDPTNGVPVTASCYASIVTSNKLDNF